MAKELSTKVFIISQIIILTLGLGFLGGLYYILNFEQLTSSPTNSPHSGTITSTPKTLTLQLSSPQDDVLTFQKEILISGITAPNLTVLYTSQAIDEALQAKNDGSFSMVVNLAPGVNRIKVVVFDENGDTKEVDRTIFYSKEKL